MLRTVRRQSQLPDLDLRPRIADLLPQELGRWLGFYFGLTLQYSTVRLLKFSGVKLFSSFPFLRSSVELYFIFILLLLDGVASSKSVVASVEWSPPGIPIGSPLDKNDLRLRCRTVRTRSLILKLILIDFFRGASPFYLRRLEFRPRGTPGNTRHGHVRNARVAPTPTSRAHTAVTTGAAQAAAARGVQERAVHRSRRPPPRDRGVWAWVHAHPKPR